MKTGECLHLYSHHLFCPLASLSEKNTEQNVKVGLCGLLWVLCLMYIHLQKRAVFFRLTTGDFILLVIRASL